MADTIVRALLPPSSGTVTLNLYEPGSTTVSNTGGDSATEDTGGKGYEWTVTEALSGLYLARLLDSDGGEIGSGAVVLVDDTGPYYLGDPQSVAAAQAIQAKTDLIRSGSMSLVSHLSASGRLTFETGFDYQSITIHESAVGDWDGDAMDAGTYRWQARKTGFTDYVDVAAALIAADADGLRAFSFTVLRSEMPTRIGAYKSWVYGVAAGDPAKHLDIVTAPMSLSEGKFEPAG